MSKMRSFLKPPLPKSPLRLRSRQVLHSNSSSLPGSLKKSQIGTDLEKPKLPIDYDSIANEIHALAKMVKDEFSEEENKKKSRGVDSNLESLAAKSVPVFERGRFYEAYSAKRNERLKRKKAVDEGTPYNLKVNHEPMTTKRRGTTSKKKTVSMVETTTSRYSLRSMTKENRKPPPVVPINMNVSVTTRRSRRI